MYFQRLFITLLFILFSQSGFSDSFYRLPHNPQITKAEEYILLNHIDSANLILNEIKDTTFASYIRFINTKILKADITYKDLNIFMLAINNKSEIPPLYCHQFLQRQSIKVPSSKNPIDRDYVNLTSTYLTFLADRGFMKEASVIFEEYSAYLSNYPKNSRLEKIAYFAKNIYPIMLAMASKNLEEGIKLSQENIDLAHSINESKFLIKAYSVSLPFIMMQGDLNKYIETCQQIIDLEDQRTVKTTQYTVTIFNLLDALMYQAHSSKDLSKIEHIKNLLDKAYESTALNTKINSYNYYVQFLLLIDEDSKEAKRILDQFKVNNIPELCQLTISESKKIFTNIELVSIYNILINTLKVKGYFKEALDLSQQSNQLVRKSYNEDLSEQLAKHKVSIAEKQEAHAVQLLETKSELYRYIFIVLFIIIIIIAWTIRLQNTKNKALDKSNKEKLLLLKEIHHRVKNNFQIASGLLELQFKDVQDEEINTLVQQWQTRIKSMTSIHQKLYQNDLLMIDLYDYISSISNDLSKIYGDHKTDIRIDIKAQYFVDIDTAVNLGLILTELITNAFKYGKKNNVLSLSIKCEKHKDEYKLYVSDSGEGIHSSIDILKSDTLGIKLIKQLLKQLQGQLNYQNKDGAHFSLAFKDSTQRILVD